MNFNAAPQNHNKQEELENVKKLMKAYNEAELIKSEIDGLWKEDMRSGIESDRLLFLKKKLQEIGIYDENDLYDRLPKSIPGIELNYPNLA